jgi:cytoskeletal protein RodZ
MPHLDEGTLHALLDGELELDEVKEIQTHLGTCAACGSRLQDVKQFLAEADSLVGALETPAGAPKVRREPAPPPRSPLPPPHGGEPWREPVWDSSPKILLPEDLDENTRRRRWVARIRWAAMIVLVLGVGQLARSMFTPKHPELQLYEPDVSSATPTTSPPVVSPQERSTPAPAAAKAARPTQPPPSRPAPAPAAPEPKVVAEQQTADTAADEFDSTTVASALEDTASSPAQVATAGAAGAAAAEADRPDTERSSDSPRASQSADAATRRAAAAALEELDRERIRARANAATASLPPARTDPAPAVQTAPPPPRTLEQRAQVYLRIGLDEAVKQLGHPAHVIEGMTPQFIGLTQGRGVPGADPARPVVRVVYLDTRGRLILLDQQRMQPGQAAPAPGGLRWAVGDILMYLHGEPAADVLRNLQSRVR